MSYWWWFCFLDDSLPLAFLIVGWLLDRLTGRFSRHRSPLVTLQWWTSSGWDSFCHRWSSLQWWTSGLDIVCHRWSSQQWWTSGMGQLLSSLIFSVEGFVNFGRSNLSWRVGTCCASSRIGELKDLCSRVTCIYALLLKLSKDTDLRTGLSLWASFCYEWSSLSSCAICASMKERKELGVSLENKCIDGER